MSQKSFNSRKQIEKNTRESNNTKNDLSTWTMQDTRHEEHLRYESILSTRARRARDT